MLAQASCDHGRLTQCMTLQGTEVKTAQESIAAAEEGFTDLATRLEKVCITRAWMTSWLCWPDFQGRDSNMTAVLACLAQLEEASKEAEEAAAKVEEASKKADETAQKLEEAAKKTEEQQALLEQLSKSVEQQAIAVKTANEALEAADEEVAGLTERLDKVGNACRAAGAALADVSRPSELRS